MDLLFISRLKNQKREYLEFASGLKAQAHFASTTEQVVSVLNSCQIDKVILMLQSVRDVGVLKYINDYFPAINVILVANNEFEEMISVFSKGRYSVLEGPLSFSDLKLKLLNNYSPV